MTRFKTKVWPKSRSTRICIGIVAVIVILIAITAAAWDPWLRVGASETESNGDTLRTVGLLSGGLLAFLFGIWRATVAERQADAAQKQVETAQIQAETAQKGFLNDRYQRAAELLSAQTLAVRLGGIYALSRLAEENPEEYHVQCMELLCAFVRHPTPDASMPITVLEEWGSADPRVREDVQAALSGIGERNPAFLELEREHNFRIDLRNARLVGADLREHLLVAANLEHARLMSADLDQAVLIEADLSYAKLSGANLSGAFLPGASCLWTQFSGVTAQDTILRGAYLEGSEWNGARMQGAYLSDANLIGADLQAANLNGTDLSGAIFGRGRRMVGPPPFEITQEHHTRLTQAQLDQSFAEHGTPPQLRDEVTDSETHEPLIWKSRAS